MNFKITNTKIIESINLKDEAGNPIPQSYDPSEFSLRQLRKNVQTALDAGYEFVSALELKQAIQSGSVDKKIALVFTEAFSPQASHAVLDVLEEMEFQGHAGFTIERSAGTYSLNDPMTIDLMHRVVSKGYDLGIRMGAVDDVTNIKAEVNAFEEKTDLKPTILTYDTLGKDEAELQSIFKDMEDAGLVSMYDPIFKTGGAVVVENSNGLYKRAHPIKSMVDNGLSGMWNILPCWLSPQPNLLPAQRLMQWPECQKNRPAMEEYFSKTKQPILDRDETSEIALDSNPPSANYLAPRR